MIFASDVILLSLIIILLLYLYLTKEFRHWKARNVPHHKPLLLFGNLYDVVVNGVPVANYLAKLYREFQGPYFGFFGMMEPFLVIKDPSIIKRILVTDFQAFAAKTFINDEKIDPIFSSVLFTLKNPTWFELRSRITPLFTSGKIKSMFHIIEQSGDGMCRYLDKKLNQIIDAKEVAAKYSTDVIAACSFGIQVNAFLTEKCEFREAAKKQFSPKLTRALQPLAYIFAHPLVKLFKLKFIETEAANYFRCVFNKSLADRESTNFKKDDLIDTLLFLKNNSPNEVNKFQFTGDRLVAQAIIFYVAGNEGISNAIALTLLELAVYPHMQIRLRKEIKSCITPNKEVTYTDIQNLKYLHMVISETFRKYPFTAFVHRQCTERYIIKETGLELQPGLKILIPLQGLHWDPQYFPEPEKYDPERFSEEKKSERPEYSYIPFGGGPRSCIGNRFALLTIQLAIVKVLLNYNVDKDANVKYPLEFGVSFFLHSRENLNLIFTRL